MAWRSCHPFPGALLVAALAAANFLPNLGSSSLFIDEGISWGIASAPLERIPDLVRAIEITPPSHYFALRAWLIVGGSDEAWMRLPQAVAAIATALSVVWVGTRAASARVGVLAGALCALSPLMLEYAQQARAYAWAALCCTVAVGCVLEARRPGRGTRSRRLWVAGAGASALLALGLHYTTALLVGPLLLLSLVAARLRRRELVAVAGVLAIALLALGSLLSNQVGPLGEGGISQVARLTPENVVELLGAPFDGREGGAELTLVGAIGAVLTTVAAASVLSSSRTEGEAVRRLVLPLPYLCLGGLLLLSASVKGVLLPRYLIVAAPLMVVTIAAATFSLPRAAGAALAAAALLTALAGSVLGHTVRTQYPDLRTASELIARDSRPSDVVALSGHAAIGPAYHYYAQRAGISDLQMFRTGDPFSMARIGRHGRRIWFVGTGSLHRRTLERALTATPYRLEYVRRLAGTPALTAALAEPRGSPPT